MKKLLPFVAMLMLTACAHDGCCGKCQKESDAKQGYCEHCTTGKGECTCE